MKKPVLSGRSGDYPVGPSAADPQPMTASGFSASVPNAPTHEAQEEPQFCTLCCDRQMTEEDIEYGDQYCALCRADAMHEAQEEDDDYDWEEEDDRAEILGYVCMSCGHSQATRGLDQCNKCCGPLEEWYD